MADVKAGLVVKGGARLRRTLRQAGSDLADLKTAHLAAANIAASHARSLAPVGPTGRTKGSIRPGATKISAVIRAGRGSLPYVGRVHYGDPGSLKAAAKRTWARMTTALGGHKIQPHPYLTDGAQQSEPIWGPAYYAALEDAIRKVEGA